MKFTFQPGLNVIIGANNAAKSAVIDALRVIYSLGTFEKKEDLIRLRPVDVFSDGPTTPPRTISFTATFYGNIAAKLPAQFYELLCSTETPDLGDESNKYAVFRLRYSVDFEYSDLKGKYEHVRSELRGGNSLTNPVPHDVLDSMCAIYLAPLRDLVNDRVRVGAEIERLIQSHTPKDKVDQRKNIPAELKAQVLKLVEDVTDNKHNAAAGRNLAQYAKPYEIGSDSLSFVPSGISEDLFRNMLPIFEHSLHGQGKLPLGSNGLGINQLIYASIVLSRRGSSQVDDHVRKFFLIEEPEAHLHPQLQDSFFHALNQITDHQIFVTSHSPTITAKTDIDKITVMRRDDKTGTAHRLHLAEAFKDLDDDKKYLHKFLDVTRSQLLFAKGAVFVEGVTEALLMQRFSEIIGLSLRDRGIEVVVIDSCHGFDHFRPLFDRGDGAYYRAVFITDGDEDPRSVATDEQIKEDHVSQLDQGMATAGSTATATGYGTFEFGLLIASVINGGNGAMQETLGKALARAAPSAVTGANKQAEFVLDFMNFSEPSVSYRKMKENSKGTFLEDEEWESTWHTNSYFKEAKSDFAFHLYELLAGMPLDAAAKSFNVPKYIRDAIEFVVGGSSDSVRSTDAADA